MGTRFKEKMESNLSISGEFRSMKLNDKVKKYFSISGWRIMMMLLDNLKKAAFNENFA
jgi:hypothetical protein